VSARGIEDFVRWLQARGVTGERLDGYRECAVAILREAGAGTIDTTHVEAARQTLERAGARPQTLVHLRNVADALRRFQRADVPPPRATSAAKPAGSQLWLWAFALTPLIVAAGAVVAYRSSAGSRPLPAEYAPGARAAGAPGEQAEVRKAYAEFQAAMLAGDLNRLRASAADDQLAELSAPDAPQKLELARALYPKDAAVQSVAIRADSAVITARAPMMDTSATGRIELVRKGGRWKVRKADWHVSLSGASEGGAPTPRRNVARPADFPQLVGVWKGGETTGRTDWTLTFADGYRISALSAEGDFYEGEVMIRWDLGVEAGVVHVPPGWAPLDVVIDKASWKGAAGQVALAAFSLSRGELRLCGGPPGYTRRVRSFESPGPQYRCLTLSRTSGAPTAAPAASATALPDPAAPGEATLLLDGSRLTYVLKTGFSSETRLSDPRNGTLHFGLHAPDNINAQRIVLTLDAGEVGLHRADGDSIHEMMFNDRAVAVGQTQGGARAAVLKWIADGGQVYPPKRGTACDITVLSPYTGRPDSQFRAEIAHCAVHSAGIDHTIADVKLRITGALDR
jgi:hypothetical protein